jgi:DNA-binding NtrC family response regulator
MKQLTSKEREFLSLVSRAAFANPFSEDRIKLDLEISGVSSKLPDLERIKAAHNKVLTFLEQLDKTDRGNISAFNDSDRLLLIYAHLFDIFHRFMEKFDELISNQIKTEDASCPVPFADDVISLMLTRGFTKQNALRYFAMFYQLRRAYYFIDFSLIGRCASMKHLRLSLWNNVFTHDMHMYEKHLWNRMEDFSTLLLGETGTGKGASATAIGRSGFIPFDDKKKCFSESFMKSFIAINLSQFPEALIESELFGHKKGAFTGAVEAHEGVFARCSPHGAIFLDEIGDASIPVQIKLLKVLQERVFSPVGSHQKHRFRGRVIAASNKSINEMRNKNLFRNDFFYRLCSDVITVPPLRQRINEDPRELDELLALTIKRIIGETLPELTNDIKKIISQDLGKDYKWPGNVRELEQCVRRILLTHTYKGDLLSVSSDLRDIIMEKIDVGKYDAQALLADYCQLLHKRYGTYEEVARRTNLDRRTVKKYIMGRGE